MKGAKMKDWQNEELRHEALLKALRTVFRYSTMRDVEHLELADCATIGLGDDGKYYALIFDKEQHLKHGRNKILAALDYETLESVPLPQARKVLSWCK